MVATRATCAVRVSGPAVPAYDQVDPERLLRTEEEVPMSQVQVIAGSSSTHCKPAEQFERGGLIEQDEVSLPMHEVGPSAERLMGGKMIYMRKRQ
jgi:hypothetical protein